MIIFEDQLKTWRDEFVETWKLQGLYGDEFPDLWPILFKKAKIGTAADLIDYFQGSLRKTEYDVGSNPIPEQIIDERSDADRQLDELVKIYLQSRKAVNPPAS